MPTEKLVDGDFLAKLGEGSYENVIGAVDEAVVANAELFGGDEKSVRTYATYAEHVVVVNRDGEFFRSKWSVSDDNEIVLSDIQEMEDVPVFEAEAMGTQVRDESEQATKELMAGRVPEDQLRSLYHISRNVRLTAEGVEDLFNKQAWFEADWYKAVEEKDKEIRGFLGTEVVRLEVPKPRFEALVKDQVADDQVENHRDGVVAAIKKLRTVFANMKNRTALARQVTESHRLRDKDDEAMAATDFVQFVTGYSEDLDGVLGILNDAVAVSDSGCVRCLARVHDGIADQAYEWTLAAAFSEKLARRFEPVAA